MTNILFVGDRPSEVNDILGYNSKWFQKLLSSLGFNSPNFIYAVNIYQDGSCSFQDQFYQQIELPKYTKTGKISKNVYKQKVESEELKQAKVTLAEELLTFNPNLIIALGEDVLNLLCGVSGIHKYRGSILECTLVPGFKILPVIDPQWIMSSAQWEYYFILINDLKKAKREAEFKELKADEIDYIIAPGFNVAMDYLHELSVNNARYAFDIETRHGFVACAGFCYNDRPICIPFQTTQGNYWTVGQESAVWKKINEVFQKNPNLVGQNLSYDLDYMLNYGIEAKNVFLDTMIGQFILMPEMQKGLDYICSLYTNAVYYKDEGKTWNSKVPDEQLWKYNCKDTFYTLKASYEIEKTLKHQNLWPLWENYGRELINIALEIQKRGLEVNKEQQVECQKVILNEYAALRPKVVSAVGFNINVNSAPVVQKYIKEELGLPLKKNYKTGKDTAAEAALMKFLVKPLTKNAQKTAKPWYKEHLTLIMKERHLRKAGTYVGIKIASGGSYATVPTFCDADGFVRSSVNTCGTKTWRFSMSENPHGTGWNLQTAPKPLRIPYDAPEGRIFLQPDQKQAEARVVAWMAQCKKQIDLFNDPSRSIHLEFGKTIFGEIKKDTPQYTAAKSGVHGGNFRMMADRLATTTGVDIPTCELALNGYHKLYPEIRFKYHNYVKDYVLKNGYLENPFGLKRYFFHALAGAKLTGKLSNDDWNDICSWIPQSTIPFITNLTYLRLCDMLPYVWLHQQGHDAVLISVPIGKEKETSDSILSIGKEIKFLIRGRELCIPWEVTMGYNWGFMFENYDNFSYDTWRNLMERDRKADKTGSGKAIIHGIYGLL
jgi:DNA polymerase I-like protein with 3'-5' exonuclease and polymerase domains